MKGQTLSNGTVLVVDDVATDRLVLARYLAELGYTAEMAENGQVALELARNLPIDLILLDLDMPTMDGTQVLEAMRQDERLRSIPVIVVSGYGDALRCIEAGVDDYMSKPFNSLMLRARIANSLEKKRLRDVQAQHLLELRRLRDELEQSNQGLKQANLTLQDLAYTDYLTGLPNRRSGMISLEQHWALYRRTSRPLCGILFDLDHFKQTNDHFGHDCGDYVLHSTARLMQDLTRAGDVLCRYGGEEFLVICPDTDLEGGRLLANRLRSRLESTPFQFRDFSGPVTASFGVAQAGYSSTCSDELLRQADQALYRAKGEGRNRVACHAEELALSPPSSTPQVVSGSALSSPARLQALLETRLVDSPQEDRLQRLVSLAASLLHAPVVLISLVTTEKQFFAASCGLAEPWRGRRETPLTHSFCKIVVETGSPLIVSDARTDQRVCENLAIPDLGVEAYLGVPLRTQAGEVLGSLCVIDSQSRRWTDDEQRLLQDMAQAVMADVELRMGTSRQQALSESYREARLAVREDEPAMLLANASHELRTPLNGILGMCELIRSTPLSEEQREYLLLLSSSADCLLDTVNDILDLAKVRAGQLQISVSPLALREVLAELLKPLALRATQEGLKFYLDVDPDVPDGILVDPIRLRQVLVNLVSNALKFTSQGYIEVLVGLQEPWLVFQVVDTGIGIPADRLSDIFQPFRQIDNELSGRHRGTGLGLSIAQQLVGAMGGELGCESQLGQGSRFHFRLPLKLSDQPDLEGFHGGSVGLEVHDPHLRGGLEDLLRAGKANVCANLDSSDRVLIEVDDEEAVARLYRQRPTQVAVLCPPGWRPSHPDLVHQPIKRISWPVSPGQLRQWLLGVDGPPLTEANLASVPLKVLVLDDNRVNQKVAGGMLRRLGHVVETADVPSQALALLENGSFDVVLVDIEMPEMDGYTFARLLRQQGDATILVAVTAHAGEANRQLCLESGMDFYLAKPLSLLALGPLLLEIEQRLEPTRVSLAQ